MPRVLVCVAACAALLLMDARAESADIWTKDTNGWARHASSRLGCPPDLATKGDSDASRVTLVDVIVGSSQQPAGNQVGCNYEGAQGTWASVEITKLRASESVAARAAAMDSRIQVQFPSAKRVVRKTSTHPAEVDKFTSSIGRKPTNRTGGETFTSAFYDVKVGDRAAVVAVAGGDVGGWLLTLVQLDYGSDATDLQAVTVANWETLVGAGLGGQHSAFGEGP